MPIEKREQKWIAAESDPDENYTYTVSVDGVERHVKDKQRAWEEYCRDRGPGLTPKPHPKRSDGAVWMQFKGTRRTDPAPWLWMIPAPAPDVPPMPENF